MNESFDLPPDGGAELAALLERSGVDFVRQGDQFRFRFASGGCAWQTVCQCRGDLCGTLNSQVVRGSFFLWEERIVFRTSARLTEAFEAQERIAAALEYNVAAISRWWESLTAGAQGLAQIF